MNFNLNEKLLESNVYVISDVHLGDRTNKDNFNQYEHRFIKFLDFVEKDPNYLLVINGDLFEFWQCQHGAIFKEYYDLLKRLINMNSVLIIGNHDIDLLDLLDLPVTFPLKDRLCYELSFMRNGNIFRICHGHEFDKYNTAQNVLFGKIGALFAAWVEMKVGTRIITPRGEKSTEGVLDMILRKCAFFFANIYNSLNPTARQRLKDHGNIDEYEYNLIQYNKANPRLKLVCGHTHESKTIADWYFNCGSWQESEAHYVIIDKIGKAEVIKFM
ncbi:MAG: metallophosphoesterase [Phenylobacterium sp.]